MKPSPLLKTPNIKLTKLLRPFSCSLFQLNESTIKSSNSLGSPSPFICYNPVLPISRDFHTMNVSRNKNQSERSSINNQSSFSGESKTQEGQTINNQPVDPKDKKSRFKALIRDYGLTAVIFHVTISLASLGICYLLVNSSLPMDKIFNLLGIDQKLGNLSDAASTSTNFVVAYAVHKSLALIRLSITAACVPIIVRYLRSKGIIKTVGKVVKKVN